MRTTENQGWGRIELEKEFERQAEWRRDKAAQYPEDDRNMEAAAMLDELVRSVAECPTDVIDDTGKLFADLPAGEDWAEMLQGVGYHYVPISAEQFCRDFISRQTS
ncbi:MAG: hypothetical protein KF861_02125 [Planctomycetaceae bacterium]|nr:hypothetical protein [Planctomycetaceae bacterium]